MDDPATCFEQEMKERGVEASVSHDMQPAADVFDVKVSIHGDTHRTSFSVAAESEQYMERTVRTYAREFAESMKSEYTETYEWGDNVIRVSMYDGASAQCLRCGETVELADVLRQPVIEQAEMATPNPTPFEDKSVLEQVDAEGRHSIRMLLVSMTRRRCDHRKI